VRIGVDLGLRSYEVILSSGFADLGCSLQDAVGPAPRVVVVSCETVWALYADDVLNALSTVGVEPEVILVEEGESAKSMTVWSGLVSSILSLGIDRSTVVVSVGGGVIGDLAGFAAATVLRGLPYVQVPTTLLAMVDSSVGGKTGINTAFGKNLIGAFHQPRLVYAPMDTIRTLPDDEFRSGLGEVVKHAVIGDSDLFATCASRAQEICERDPGLVMKLVERSIRLKAGVVSGDERESGYRAVLNLGHTVGHALEVCLLESDAAMPHGLCVAIGLLSEVRWAEAQGDCPAGTGDRVARVLGALGLPTSVSNIDVEAVRAASKFDKKVRRGKLTTAIVEDIGRVRLGEVDEVEVQAMFHSLPGF